MAIRSSAWTGPSTLSPDLGRGRDASVPEVSIVVPVCDEQANVEPLYSSLVSTLTDLGRTHEIVIVDDGSRDDTYSRLIRRRRHREYVGNGCNDLRSDDREPHACWAQ
jgi:cellulose synthase/poly-beta-1,6-N-acetylglucosamine synthase-like glycosyltransferase